MNENKNGWLLIPGIPALILMCLGVAIGFVFEGLKWGFMAGQALFEELNDKLRKQ